MAFVKRWSVALFVLAGLACGPEAEIGQARSAVEGVNKGRPGVFNPGNGQFSLQSQSGGTLATFTFGNPGDIPVRGDWDGNGSETVGVYRNGVFYLRNTNNTGYADIVKPLGLPGDQPFTGEWCGRPPTATTKVGVARSGMIYLEDCVVAGQVNQFAYGLPGDIAFTGDWTGKGHDSIGVYRPSAQKIYLKNTNETGQGDIERQVGPGIPAVADWNGDGIDSIAMYESATSTFKVFNSNTAAGGCSGPDETIQFGAAFDQPLGGYWAPPP